MIFATCISEPMRIGRPFDLGWPFALRFFNALLPARFDSMPLISLGC